MCRYARYALNTLIVLSLLPCVATVALWVDSYSDSAAEQWGPFYPHVGIELWRDKRPVKVVGLYRLNSFSIVHLNDGKPYRRLIAVGYGWITLATLFPSMLLLGVKRRIWRRRTVRSGLCARCNYDLRATPDRCPECGAIPAAYGGQS